MICVNKDIYTINATIPGQDGIYPQIHLCRTFFAEYSWGYSGSLTSSLVTHLVTMCSSVVVLSTSVTSTGSKCYHIMSLSNLHKMCCIM